MEDSLWSRRRARQIQSIKQSLNTWWVNHQMTTT